MDVRKPQKGGSHLRSLQGLGECQECRQRYAVKTDGTGRALCLPCHDGTETIVLPTVVGRNDRCPCGSGKKFKRCHLNADADPPTIPVEGEPRGVFQG